ncbi:MAG: PHB depolymerase family esterase [Candidatus Methanofastidiosia archaeon]
MHLLLKIFLGLLLVYMISGCARQGRLPGSPEDSIHTLTVDGFKRTYIVHIPSTFHEPLPLVIALHGGGGSAEKMANLTGLDALSDREGFAVVYPQGVENHWNDGRDIQEYRAHRENIDDVKFISTVIDTLSEEVTIDEKRIYAVGISNGAMMACRLACELSDRIAAIAMVAGGMPVDLREMCSPRKGVSVLLINGTVDPLVLWEGGEIQAGRRYLGVTMSVSDTVMYWVRANGCEESPSVVLLPNTHEDGCSVNKETYGKGKQGTEVVLYAIEGGGHTWPGGHQYAGEGLIGKTCYDISASEVAWQFFSAHEAAS